MRQNKIFPSIAVFLADAGHLISKTQSKIGNAILWLLVILFPVFANAQNKEITPNTGAEHLASQMYAYYLSPPSLNDIEQTVELFGVDLEKRRPTNIVGAILGDAKLPIIPSEEKAIIADATFFAARSQRIFLRVRFAKNSPCLEVARLKALTTRAWSTPSQIVHGRSGAPRNQETLIKPDVVDGISIRKSFTYTKNKSVCVEMLSVEVEARH